MKNLLLSVIILIPFYSSAQPSFKAKNLESYIEFRAQHERYSGVTKVYKGDESVFTAIYGQANRSWGIPIFAETRFNLASVTKMFTATAAGILMDRNIIELDEPIITYFQDFPNNEIAQKVTIRELLSHTSGISDFFFEKEYLETDRYRLRQLEDYDRFYETLRIADVPPNRIQYSNTNYLILGRIIEKVTGFSYYDFVQKEIFDKAGMQHTGFYETDLIIPKLAVGYTNDKQASMEFGVPNDGATRRNTYMRTVKGMPAGGAYATVHDLYLFMTALKNGELVSDKTFSLMTDSNQNGYGLGMQVYQQQGIRVIGHSGGFYGVSTMLFYLPDMDYTFISLANNDFGAQPVFDRFINNLAGLPSYDPIEVTAEKLSEFEGYFEVQKGQQAGRQIPIRVYEDRLLFDNELEFFPTGTDKFFDIDNNQFSLTFERDSMGQISGFIRSDQQRFRQIAQKIDSSNVSSLQPVDVPDDVLRQYLGKYQFGENGMMAGHRPQIIVDGGALFVDNMMRFLPFEKDKFFLQDDIGMRLIFQRNELNELTGFHVMRDDQVVGRVQKIN